LTQDPQDHTQNEVSSKTFQWRCAASVRDRSAVCGALCATRPTQKDVHGSLLESSTKPVQDNQTCSITSTQ
jgi:hypothetical protein